MNSEKIAEENEACRQIVREIGNFGTTQRQQLLIIYLLALELENIEHMQAITCLVRELDDNLFLSGAQQKEEQSG